MTCPVDGHDHEHELCRAEVSDDDRAEMLAEAIDVLCEAGADRDNLRLLPKDGHDNKDLAHFWLGKGALDHENLGDYEHTPQEAVEEVRNGHPGFAVYYGMDRHGTENVLAVDVDVRETFPYDEFPDTAKFFSGSGAGDHLLYRNDGTVDNAVAKGDADGEVRASRFYTILPGSTHPTGGVYGIAERREPATLSHDEIPEQLQPASDYSVGGENEVEEYDTPDDLENATFSNEWGTPLEDIRERDDKLDALLTHLEPPGTTYPSASEADFATVSKLWWWRFNERQIANIIRRYRNRRKVSDRDDYLPRTIRNAANGERMDPPGGDGIEEDHEYDPGYVSTLPLEKLTALGPQQRREYAQRRGENWPTTEEARERLFDEITEAMAEGEKVVIDAPTALGKSHLTSSAPWGSMEDVTGGKRTVKTSETRDARDETREAAREAGTDYMTLFSRTEACSCAAGEHDPRNADGEGITVDGTPVSQFIDYLCDYKDLPFSVAHRYIAENNDQGVELPCMRGDTECLSISQYEALREGDHDLIIATHNFLYVPGLRMHTNVIVDEELDFTVEMSQERVQRAIAAFLRYADAPVTTWEDFIALARTDAWDTDAGREAEQLRDALDVEPDVDWYYDDPEAHSLAPAIARAIFHAQEEPNGRLMGKTAHDPPRLDAHAHEDESWNRLWVSVVLDENNTVRTIRSAPDFSQTRSLIGLDAHPSMIDWQLNASPYIERRQVLDSEERQLWRRHERGLLTVQVGDATRPLTSGEYFNEGQVEALLRDLRREFGDEFRTAITSAAAEDDLNRLMENVGISSPETMHYGGEKSRNDFGNEHYGLVNGCIDPGDGPILDKLAEAGLEAEPEPADVCCEVCGDREDAPEEPGDGCPECNGSGWAREAGRGFVGPDEDKAQEILASVRENHVAQAAGRYARNPDDPDSWAIVFIRTDASPPGFIDHKVSSAPWIFTEKQKEIIRSLRGSGEGSTAREIAEECGVTKEYVRQVLSDLHDRGKVKALDKAARNGATLYRDDGTPPVGISELVDANSDVWNSYTWSLAIQDPVAPERGQTATPTTTESETPTIWPPDEAARTADPPDPGG